MYSLRLCACVVGNLSVFSFFERTQCQNRLPLRSWRLFPATRLLPRKWNLIAPSSSTSGTSPSARALKARRALISQPRLHSSTTDLTLSHSQISRQKLLRFVTFPLPTFPSPSHAHCLPLPFSSLPFPKVICHAGISHRVQGSEPAGVVKALLIFGLPRKSDPFLGMEGFFDAV